MTTDPRSKDAEKRLALIQRLWDELKDARNDPQKYETLVKWMREETDAFRKMLDTPVFKTPKRS